MIGFVCEVTPKCNLACGFCYNVWRTPGINHPRPLPFEPFAELLTRTLREAKADWLSLAGGEPLLYPGLETLLQCVAESLPQLKIGLLSNGTLLTRQRLAGLARVGLDYVELSLFASSRQRYEALTGHDLLETAQRAILCVKEQGLPLTVACTLLSDGLDEFENVLMMAIALGADAVCLNPFTPTGHGKTREKEWELSQAQLESFLAIADRLAGKMPVPVTVTLPVEDCVIPHDRYPHLSFGSCQCGERKWVIDPQGFLRACEQNETQIGNLMQQSFSELAAHPGVLKFREQNRHAACKTCLKYKQCGGGCRFRATC